MTILKELLYLFEAKEKNLIGLTISGKLITEKTPSEPWPDNFNCYNNKLTSLQGAPNDVGGYFGCFSNKLTSIQGAPTSVGVDFNCSDNDLTSLQGIHKILKKMNGTFYAHDNHIKSHVIGLMLVQGCKKVRLDNKQVEEIMNKYLPNTTGNRGLLDCQGDLIDAGFGDYAEL